MSFRGQPDLPLPYDGPRMCGSAPSITAWGFLEMTTLSIRGRTLIYGAVGLAIALTPAVAVVANSSAPAPRVLACQETETEDSFSMNCGPTVLPDTSDNLTEAEVAQPGWNNGYGGANTGLGHGGNHG